VVSLFFVFGLSDLTPAAYAGQTSADMSITPPTHIARIIGEYTVFYVNIYNVENLSTARFTIVYNASVLQLSKVVQQSFFPPAPQSSFQYEAVGSLLQVNLSLANSEAPLRGNGTLVYISFKVVQKPTSCIVSTIGFSQVSLLDSSAMPIPCDVVGAVCFWGYIGPDPPGDGLLVPYTNKETFMVGETVFLYSRVTYGGDPVRNKLVAFQVLNPTDNSLTMGVVMTDQNGIAVVSFKVPDVGSSIGIWTAFSTVDMDQEAFWGVVNFQVGLVSAVGGYSFTPIVVGKVLNPLAPYVVLLVLLTLVSIVCRPRRRK